MRYQGKTTPLRYTTDPGLGETADALAGPPEDRINVCTDDYHWGRGFAVRTQTYVLTEPLLGNGKASATTVLVGRAMLSMRL